MMFWYGNSGWPWWSGALMWIGMIAFWALLIWAVYVVVTGITRPDRGRQPGDARQILDERLARGEIDDEEYRRLRDILDGGSGRSPAQTRR